MGRGLRTLLAVSAVALYLCSAYGWSEDMFPDWQSGKIWQIERSRRWYNAPAFDLDSGSQRVISNNRVFFCSLRLGEILLQWSSNLENNETAGVKDKLHKVQCSLYNRGDDGDMDEQQFRTLFESYQEKITKSTGIRKMRSTGPRKAANLRTEVWKWESPRGIILLIAGRSILDRKQERMEYIRLVLLRDRKDVRNGDAGGGKASHLLESVARQEDGTVWIKGIPMVDQGSKGYCVPASVARVFAHYGVTSVDMHTLAALCNTATEGGTSLYSMREALKKISWHFNMTLNTVAEYWQDREKHLAKYDRKAKKENLPPRKHEKSWFEEVDPQAWSDVRSSNQMEVQKWLLKIRSYVNRGVPVLWSVAASEMYCHKDQSIRGGPHMRLIIGYNQKKGTIIFSDSWGKFATRRDMKINAFANTDCLYVLRPR